MQSHLHQIKELISHFDAHTLAAMAHISHQKTYPKGTYLLEAGSICTKSYWVTQGILRSFYLHNGKEVTTDFYFKEDLAVSFNSYVLQQPSQAFIQAVTEVTVHVTDYLSFNTQKAQNSQLQAFDFLITEHYALCLEQKVMELHTQNASQRYQTLLEKSPHIVQQVPLTQIASYLNVSLETLSRIRAKK